MGHYTASMKRVRMGRSNCRPIKSYVFGPVGL